MATLLHSESRRLYSWWWDSHIPKNSKWLQDNLADMDTKVKSMIKLIEEDADSFARRAEMYYKKRPELMKLVEEFYRAYRALAERYDHATVELRHVHKTMAEAFPNQLPFEMNDDSTSIQPFYDSEDLQKDGSSSKRGLKELNDLFGNPDDTDVEALKRILTELQVEKEALNLQNQLSLNKLSKLGKDFDNAQNDAKGFDDRATEAEIEIKILKEALEKLKVERDEGLIQYNQSMERIIKLEALIFQSQEDKKGLIDRASKAEIDAENLNQELSRLHTEKEDGLARHEESLEMISSLEKKIRDVEESAEMFKNQYERAEDEIKSLKQELMKTNNEWEDLNLRYNQCLERIAKLEIELSYAQDNAKRLSSEVLAGAAKLKTVEDQCVLLESSNQTLKAESDSLMRKIATKDQELEKLQALLEEEYSRFSELEAKLRNLRSLHSQSQKEQNALTVELQSSVQTLKGLEIQNHKLEDDINSVKEENRTLSESNNSSTIALQIQQNEISGLKEMKEKLEVEVTRQMNQSNILQEEIYRLKDEIDSLNMRYQTLMEQIRLAGLDPECFDSSLKKLKDENLELIELCNSHRSEKEALSEKLNEMDDILQKNALLEKSLLESNTKLESSKEKADDLRERCKSLRGEKTELVADRSNLLSQLQLMTENMKNLLEKNTLLENSLSNANIELEGLRVRSKCFEEFFELIKNEKTDLLKERESLLSQMNRIERNLGVLEKNFSELEGKYFDLQKEKQFSNFQVEELRASLAFEKQERVTYERSTETRLIDLQKNVSFLREECRSRKKEFEEELDRAVNAQVEIFILQKFIEDLEQKNFSLLIECQKYVEASKFSEKLISELESENLEQRMEAEFLLGEIENLRGAIYKVLKALQLEPDYKIAKESIPISRIVGEINDLRCSLSTTEDSMQRLVVENSVLLSLLEQIQSDGSELESEKNVLEKDLGMIIEQHELLKKDKQELLEMNLKLKSELIERDHREQEIRVELQTEHVKMENLNKAYKYLQEEYSNALDKNKTLLQKFSALKGEMCMIQEENSAILQEAFAFSNMTAIYQSIEGERGEEIKAITASVKEINAGFKRKVESMEEKLRRKEAESEELNKKLEKLHELNNLLEHKVSNKDEILRQKTTKLREAEDLLKATQIANVELCETVEELKKECEELREMKEKIEKQEEEIKKMKTLNENLESEVMILHREIEEQRVREEYLSMELREKTNEFGLWDAEATSFYFDLQISAVREVLLENKIQELNGVYENLKDESIEKTKEIKRMKETMGFMEYEIGELKNQLSAYDPIVTSLAQDVKSLEQGALFDPRGQDVRHEEYSEGQSSKTAGNGIMLLREIKTRVKSIEQTVMEERDRLVKQSRRSSSNRNREANGEIKMERSRAVMSEMKGGLLMKDIPLDPFYRRNRGNSCDSNDQMLELWEESAEAEKSTKNRNPSAELQSEKVVGVVEKLELSEDITQIQTRLLSDSRRLANLRISIKDLKRKLEMKEKQGRFSNQDYVRTRRRLNEMEETILQLINTTEILSKEIDETGDARDIYRKVVIEKSKNGSEKIEHLRIEMENIERMVLKLDDGAKSRLRKKFSESRTVILLKDIIHKSGKRTARKKKNRFCGCMSSPVNED